MPRLPLTAAIAAGLLLVFGPAAHACTCLDPGPPCQAYWTTGVLFRGRVEWIGRPADRKTDPHQIVTVRFAVLEPFKGVQTSTVDVRTPTGPASCALRFRNGGEYVVHASRVNGVVTTSACSRTRRVDRAADDLEYARSLVSGGAALGRISGRVALYSRSLWARGSHARSVRDVPVTLRRGDEFAVMVRTDRSGEFAAAGLDAGTYRIDVAPLGRYRVEAPSGITLADPRACAIANIALYPDGRVSGRVVDSNGNPVRGLTVDLAAQPDDDPAESGRPLERLQAVTAVDGVYEFTGISPGRFVVRLGAGPLFGSPEIFHPGVTNARHATAVAVAPGGEMELADLVIPADLDVVEIAGTVLDADGFPAARARVYLRGAGDNERVLTAPVTTDTDGRFTIAAPGGREYLVFAERPNKTTRGRVDCTPLVPITTASRHPSVVLTLRRPR